MPDALVLTHLVVAVTLAVAAGGKWRHPDRDNRTLAGVGPEWIRRPFVRRWHPVAELALGLGIVLLPARWNLFAVVGAAALLVAYLVLVVLALRAPGPVSCGCFGAGDSAPVSRRTLARNLVLVVAAGLAVLDAALGGSVVGRLGDADTRWWLLGVLLAVAVTFLAASAPVGPGDGDGSGGPAPAATYDEDDGDDELEDYLRTEIPDVSLHDPDGHPVPLRPLAARRAQLLVFVSPTCGPCAGIARDLPRWRQREHPIDIRAVVHSKEVGRSDTPVWVEAAMVDPDGEVARALAVGATPGAVLLGADGLLAGGPVVGAGSVREFYVAIAEQLEAATEVS